MSDNIIQIKYNKQQSIRVLEKLINNPKNQDDIGEQALNILKNTQKKDQQQSILFYFLTQNNNILNISDDLLLDTATQLTIQDHSVLPFLSLAENAIDKKHTLTSEQITPVFHLFSQTYPVQNNALIDNPSFQTEIQILFDSKNTIIDNEKTIEMLDVLQNRQAKYHETCQAKNDDEALEKFNKDLISPDLFQYIINFTQDHFNFSQDKIINLLEKTQRMILEDNHACFYILKNNHSANILLDRSHILQTIELCPHMNDCFDLALKHNESQSLGLTLNDFKLFVKIMAEDKTEDFTPLDQMNSKGNTPLMQAIIANNEDLALYILKFRPNLTMKNSNQNNALDLAFMKNHSKLINTIKVKITDKKEIQDELQNKEKKRNNKIVPIR